MAFATRYGHSDVVGLLGRPLDVIELSEYVTALGELLGEENALSRQANDQ